VSSDWGSLAERMGHARNHIPRAAAYSRLSAYRQRRGYRPISKRLGHAKPSVTLAIYAHMFHIDDSRAAAAINAALG